MFSKGIRLRIKNPVFQSWLRCMRLGKVFLKCGIYTQNNILKCDCGRDSKGSMVMCRYAVFRFVHFFLQINSLRNSRLRKGRASLKKTVYWTEAWSLVYCLYLWAQSLDQGYVGLVAVSQRFLEFCSRLKIPFSFSWIKHETDRSRSQARLLEE